MNAHRPVEAGTLSAIREIDRWAREYAQEIASAVELKV
jgi:hypothetical protein